MGGELKILCHYFMWLMIYFNYTVCPKYILSPQNDMFLVPEPMEYCRPYFRSLYIGYLGSARRSLNLSATLKMVLAEKKYLPFITYYLSHIHIVCFTICTMFDLKVVCNLNTT